MPKVQVNVDLIGSDLFLLGDTLKAAIVVFAAAILSRTKEDIEHNGRSALVQLDEMERKVDGLRNSVHQKKGVALVAKLKGQVKEIDIDEFTNIMSYIDDYIGSCRDSFQDALESKTREGVPYFMGRVGGLGLELGRAIYLVTGVTVPITYFDHLFADTLEELSKQSW